MREFADLMASCPRGGMEFAPSSIPYRYSGIVIALAIIALILIIPQKAHASWNAGLPGAIFRMPAGAWISGMGGAGSADPEFMLSWYNPSQLPLLREHRASLGAGYRSLGRTEGWASYDFRVPPRVGMGLSLVYRGDPFIDNMYDGYYQGGDVVEERSLGGASWTALSLKIGAGYLVTRKLTLGASVAVNYQSLPTTPDDDGALHNSTVTSIGAVDIAASYRLMPDLILSASIKNLLSRNAWYMENFDGFTPATDETIPPAFALASSHKTKLWERELVWNADAVFYFIDGFGEYLGHPEMTLAAGARWKFSDAVTLRAGIGDLEFSGDMFRGGSGYWDDSFSPRAALGFSYVMPKIKQRLVFNYALMTDRVWAGIDQQIDITVSF